MASQRGPATVHQDTPKEAHLARQRVRLSYIGSEILLMVDFVSTHRPRPQACLDRLGLTYHLVFSSAL